MRSSIDALKIGFAALFPATLIAAAVYFGREFHRSFPKAVVVSEVFAFTIISAILAIVGTAISLDSRSLSMGRAHGEF